MTTDHAHLSLIIAGIWLALALIAPLLPRRPLLFRAICLGGIPVLGWLTLHWGPTAGLAALAIGVLLLCWPPLRRRTAPVPPQSPAE